MGRARHLLTSLRNCTRRHIAARAVNLLLLAPLYAMAQPPVGWVAISIQGDAYGEETTWLLRDSSDNIVGGSAPLQGQYPYVEAFTSTCWGVYLHHLR